MQKEALTILVIDANKVGRRVYSNLLRSHFDDACRILEVERGDDGHYLCSTQSIGCVLIEYNLPGMNALEFLEKLRAHPKSRFVPVVVLTGEGDEANAVSAMKAGAQDFLVKGTFSQELLANSINNAMEMVELQRELEQKRKDLERANDTLKQEIDIRKEVETNLRLFRDLMNQTVDSMFIINPKDGRLIDFNDAACDNLGYNPIKLRRMTMAEFDNTIQDQDHWNVVVARIRIKGSGTHEGTYCRSDETQFPVEVTLRHINYEDKEYLVGVARDITIRKQVEQKLRDLSNRDGLTNVYNRRFFDDSLDREWLRLKREQLPLALLLLDVDFFKFYNDNYGHQAGDECLKQVAAILPDCVRRPADFTARFGGEEFVVVLPATPAEGALKVGQALCKQVEDLQLPHEKSEVSDYVTVSLGIACMVPGDGNSVEALIQTCDKALYKAKEAGRNQCYLAT